MSPQLDVASTLAQWQAQYHGRRLSADFTDNATFRISIICISAVVGFCVVALCLGCFCILRTKQRLAEKRREELVAGPIPKGLYMRAEDEPENQGAMSMGPRPPWDDGVDPPGLVLAEQVPHSHANAVHASRSAGGPHRTRLLLLSSRVADVGVVAGAALPCIVVVSYCWKGTTLQELMSLVKKAVGSTKLISIGVIAPASRPGSVGLLDGLRTTDNTLEDDAALRTFWARLGEMVDAGGRGAAGAAGTAGAAGAAAGAAAASVGPLQQQQQLHDRGIHLLGCRTTEDLDLGACMVSALQDAAKGPKVYASDDLMSGYRLAQLGDALTESSAAGRPFSSDWAMAVGAKGAPFLVLTETEAAGIYFDVARLPGVMDAARAAAQVAPPTRAAASASGAGAGAGASTQARGVAPAGAGGAATGGGGAAAGAESSPGVVLSRTMPRPVAAAPLASHALIQAAPAAPPAGAATTAHGGAAGARGGAAATAAAAAGIGTAAATAPGEAGARVGAATAAAGTAGTGTAAAAAAAAVPGAPHGKPGASGGAAVPEPSSSSSAAAPTAPTPAVSAHAASESSADPRVRGGNAAPTPETREGGEGAGDSGGSGVPAGAAAAATAGAAGTAAAAAGTGPAVRDTARHDGNGGGGHDDTSGAPGSAPRGAQTQSGSGGQPPPSGGDSSPAPAPRPSAAPRGPSPALPPMESGSISGPGAPGSRLKPLPTFSGGGAVAAAAAPGGGIGSNGVRPKPVLPSMNMKEQQG